jgi:hypothetical protein
MHLSRDARAGSRAGLGLASGVLLLLAVAWASLGRPPTGVQVAANDSPLPTPTPTTCPSATPEPLWVDPVPAYTEQLTETVVVYIGNGEAVTVRTESGDFVLEGDFDAYAHPARVEVALDPGLTHSLRVYARVRRIEQGGCEYGGYTLSTIQDRYGKPLVIRQVGEAGAVRFLPLLYSGDAP